MAKTPQQVAEKWQRNLSASGQDIQNGVNEVRINPAQQAVAQQAKMRANVLAAIDSGKWADGLNRVTLDSWKRAMLQKGLPRITAGATEAQPKVQAFMTQLLPYQATLSAQVEAMPDLTLQDSINRMVAWVNGMAQFRRTSQ